MNTHGDFLSGGTSAARDDALAEEAATWFVRLRNDTATADERARFDAWIGADPAHRRAYEEVSAFWNDPGFTAVLRETPLTTLASERKRPRGKAFRLIAWSLSLAACAALALAMVQPAFIHCLGADYCTEIGEVRTVQLADGSRVTLNTGSALNVAYRDDVREVRLLNGEAVFDVLPDPQHPFLVDARYSRIRVKGTRFVVREESNSDTVTVISGVVEVRRTGGAPAVLRENDQIRVGEGLSGEITRVAGSVAAAWMKGAVLFDNAPLERVVDEIGRFRGGVLVGAGARARTLKVSGRFDVKNTDRALESLEQTLPIRIRRITPWLVVIQ
jgi:transmembrane sensor